MSTVSGVVTEVLEFPSKFQGGKPMYTLVVNGTKYGLGKQPNTSKVGDVVKFEAVANGKYWNIDGPVTKTDTASPKVLEAEKAANPAPSKNQDVISRQAASNTAIAYMTLLASQNALPVPAKKADAFEALKVMMVDLREEFLDYAVNGPKKPDRAAPTDAAPAPAGEWKD